MQIDSCSKISIIAQSNHIFQPKCNSRNCKVFHWSQIEQRVNFWLISNHRSMNFQSSDSVVYFHEPLSCRHNTCPDRWLIEPTHVYLFFSHICRMPKESHPTGIDRCDFFNRQISNLEDVCSININDFYWSMIESRKFFEKLVGMLKENIISQFKLGHLFPFTWPSDNLFFDSF